VTAPFPEDNAWDVLEDIPNGTAAALVLLEHHWAVGLRDAVARAGGYRVSEGFISPLDLVRRFGASDPAGLRPRDAADEAEDDVAVDRADGRLGQHPFGEVASGERRQRLGHRCGARIRPPSGHPGPPRRWAVGGPRTQGRRSPAAGDSPRAPAACAGTDGGPLDTGTARVLAADR
jgi:hypothetical protein